MSILVPQFGSTVDIVIPAGQAIAVWSQGPFQVLQAQISPPGVPAASFNVIADVGASPSLAAQYVSPTFASGATLRIDNHGGDAFYEIGTAPSVKQLRLQSPAQATPATLNATGTLPPASLLNGTVTSTTGAAVNATLPTGTVLDAASTFAIGESIEWVVVNTGATNAFTILVGTNHTIVGNPVVAASSSASFRTYKTAANTFVTERM